MATGVRLLRERWLTSQQLHAALQDAQRLLATACAGAPTKQCQHATHIESGPPSSNGGSCSSAPNRSTLTSAASSSWSSNSAWLHASSWIRHAPHAAASSRLSSSSCSSSGVFSSGMFSRGSSFGSSFASRFSSSLSSSVAQPSAHRRTFSSSGSSLSSTTAQAAASSRICRSSSSLSRNTLQAAAGRHTFSSSFGISSSNAQAAACKRTFSSAAPGAVQPDPLEEPRRTLVVAVSGGVDSAVAAMLAKQAGHDVVAVFMRNWDEGEEIGNGNCSVERDRQDAAAVCAKLGIKLHEVDFVQRYWNEVFETFLSELSRGLTPNPDLPCNRHIKFGALLDWAKSQGADGLVTGHYARLGRDSRGQRQLLRGVDGAKDQSYFLASVGAQQLEHCAFPLGGLTKHQVRAIAAASALPPATKRSSAGICFIGRRPFSHFLEQYIPPVPGRYVDVDSGTVLAHCANILAVTHGQRAPIGGGPERAYVAGKDVTDGTVWVARGKCHPALLTKSALLRPAHWVAGEAPEALLCMEDGFEDGAVQQQGRQRVQRQQRGMADAAGSGGALVCSYKARYVQLLASCVVTRASIITTSSGSISTIVGSSGDSDSNGSSIQGSSFQPSAFCRPSEVDCAVGADYLVATMDRPAWALTPQQAFALYDGDVCLGSALMARPGLTLWEEQQQQQQGQDAYVCQARGQARSAAGVSAGVCAAI